jgi:hypothetical protein
MEESSQIKLFGHNHPCVPAGVVVVQFESIITHGKVNVSLVAKNMIDGIGAVVSESLGLQTSANGHKVTVNSGVILVKALKAIRDRRNEWKGVLS